MRSDGELKELAYEIEDGRIFTDQHLKSPDQFAEVFPAAVWQGPETREKLQRAVESGEVAVFWQYTEKAQPRKTRDGFPRFLTCNTFSRAEWDKILLYIGAMRQALKGEGDNEVAGSKRPQ